MFVTVIGLGTFGQRTAQKLAEKGIEVLAIDSRADLVDKIKEKVTHAVSMDVTDERGLRDLNITDVDLAIVAIGENIEMSIMAVATLRKLGVGRVFARAVNSIHEHVLREIGASEIIKVEEEMGDIIASKIVAPYVLNHYHFATGYSIVEMKLGKLFAGRAVVESKIKQNYSLNVVAIQRRVPVITDEGKASFRVEINDSPLPMDIIREDDVLILVGTDKNFNKLYSDLKTY
jgi:trk system potassium uptake protein TrkA